MKSRIWKNGLYAACLAAGVTLGGGAPAGRLREAWVRTRRRRSRARPSVMKFLLVSLLLRLPPLAHRCIYCSQSSRKLMFLTLYRAPLMSD